MPLVHEAVRAELNARRQGTHRPRRAARCRAGVPSPGARRAPAAPALGPRALRCGPAAAPSSARSPRHYTGKVNRKARRAALRSALSVHAARGSIAVFDAGAFDAPSTKRAAEMLDEWLANEQTGSTLVLLSADEANAGLSFRNLFRVDVMPVADAGVADLMRAATLLVSEAALDPLVARAGGSGSGSADEEAA